MEAGIDSRVVPGPVTGRESSARTAPRDLSGLAFQVPCPQCGALVLPPHQVDTFPCPSCGSTLHPAAGVRVYRLTQRASVTREAAAQSVQGWFSGQDLPADLLRTASVEVGPLSTFPFLRSRTADSDRVVPLAPVPSPEVAVLGRVPAELVPDTTGEVDVVHKAGTTEPAVHFPVSEDLLRNELQAAAGEPTVQEIAFEERLFYPVRYGYRGERFSAVVEAGTGRVLASRRPARREMVGERAVAAGVGVLLFGEALLIPGLAVKLAVVAASACGLYPLVRRLVEDHG